MYPDLSTVNATADLGNLLVYANDVTGGWLMPMTLGAFFLLTFFGSYIVQLRMRGTGRIAVCFASSSFVTLGFAVLMTMKSGLLSPFYLFMSITLAIIGFLWLMFSTE